MLSGGDVDLMEEKNIFQVMIQFTEGFWYSGRDIGWVHWMIHGYVEGVEDKQVEAKFPEIFGGGGRIRVNNQKEG